MREREGGREREGERERGRERELAHRPTMVGKTALGASSPILNKCK